MLIAREKYTTNIIEYILYMFNIEDVIRANTLDITLLEKNVISKYHLPDDQMGEIRQWYKDLIAQMIKDDIQDSGHLSSLKELMFKLNDLHIELLNSLDQERYVELYHWASNYIKELKSKMNHPEMTEVEVCLNGLYAYMLMKMKGLEITLETSEAMGIFTQMMRFLSKNYMKRFAKV